MIILQSIGQQVEKEGRTGIQKIEYLKNEKSFLDEIKSIFCSLWRAIIIWWKKKIDTSFKLDQPLKQWLTGRKREEDVNIKFKHLENEKSFLDEIKNVFYSFWRAIIWLEINYWWKIAGTSFKNYTDDQRTNECG